MDVKVNELILFGLDNYKEVLKKIIKDLNCSDFDFDIKLVLTEALTNAFKYGNNYDKNKPIFLRYCFDGTSVIFEIEDSGVNSREINIPENIYEDNLLSSHGRGLFLIKSFADEFEINGSKQYIKKIIRGRNNNENQHKN